MIRSALLRTFAAAAALLSTVGCVDPQPTGTPIRVDPTITQRESGGADDVLQVCQKMLNSMRRDKEVGSKQSKLIFLDQDGIVIDPKLAGYNARMLYNELQAKLNQAAGGEYKFIDRKAVAAERQRQLAGEVTTSGVDATSAGADMILSIELIAMQGGETNTVQYNFKLTGLDTIVLWSDNATLVKRR